MIDFKINILFEFTDGPWGGGNQFLQAMMTCFKRAGVWVDSPGDADIVLFDSFNEAARVVRWKAQLPKVRFVHRINGPISGYRGTDVQIDKLIHSLAYRVADGVIFQSEYSRTGNLALGMNPTLPCTVIHNAARPEFRPPLQRATQQRMRLIAASWSPNPNKGFDVYDYLDRNLDFDRYSMTFVGNTPFAFKNIRHVPPQKSDGMIRLLQEHDIFVTASRNESCSNAILESMATGMPVVALRSGSNAEIVGHAGCLFNEKSEVLDAIDSVAENYDNYRSMIPVRPISAAADAYLSFMSGILESPLPPKHLSMSAYLELAGWFGARKLVLARDRIRRLAR